MVIGWGLGPVFAYDCVALSRRWQVYAGRSFLIASVLVGLWIVWLNQPNTGTFVTFQQLARVGWAFFVAIMGVELVLTLLLVPAATAGAICQDKLRGGLTLMMVTDLSDAEIVLGRLASRLVTVLSVIAASLPVVVLAMLLGGIDPADILSGTLVIVGVAILAVSVSLFFSVWATKAHEALMATYATWAVWLLALLAWSETSRGTTPRALFYTNPFWLLFGARWSASTALRPWLPDLAFLVGCLLVSALLMAVATFRIRAVTVGQGRDRVRKHGPTLRGRSQANRSETQDEWLDRDPILWREWHRRQPSRWARAIWTLYAVISGAFTAVAIFSNREIAPGVAGFMVAVGLLMVSVTSVTALAEERLHGSIDVLLATPLSTRSIVLGKWWGAFRIVPRLAILPGILALGCTAIPLSRLGLNDTATAMLVVAVVVSYGAAVTSLGLALATWQPRLGRAIALSVVAYLAATVVYPAVIIATSRSGPPNLGMLSISPFFAVYDPVVWRIWKFFRPSWGTVLFLTALSAALAYSLLEVTIRSFDRCLGRIPDRPRLQIFALHRLPTPPKVSAWRDSHVIPRSGRPMPRRGADRDGSRWVVDRDA